MQVWFFYVTLYTHLPFAWLIVGCIFSSFAIVVSTIEWHVLTSSRYFVIWVSSIEYVTISMIYFNISDLQYHVCEIEKNLHSDIFFLETYD